MPRNTKAWPSSLALIATLLACNSQPQQPPIPVAQMQHILHDMHLAEAYSTILAADDTSYRAYNGKNIDSLARFYTLILQQQGLALAQWDSALSWYSLHPHLLDTAYYYLLPQYDSLKTAIKAAAPAPDSSSQ